MDLSFTPFLPDREIGAPCELPLVVVVVRASETTRVQAILDAAPLPVPDRLAPVGGSFDAAVAAALWRWRGEGRRE